MWLSDCHHHTDTELDGESIRLGKRKHTPPCSSAELFVAEKNGGHRGKISVVDRASLVFVGFLYPPPAWEVFL